VDISNQSSTARRRLRHLPEIVIGFVAPSGTDRQLVVDTASRLLRTFQYQGQFIHLSDLLEERAAKSKRRTKVSSLRAWRLQDEGNRLCKDAKRPDALSFVAVNQIRATRERLQGRRRRKASSQVVPGVGYLIWSLKRPEEADTLRAIYRTRFFLISVYTPEASRRDRLTQEAATTNSHLSPTQVDAEEARRLIQRDEREPRATVGKYGQNVSDTYPLADFFVDASNVPALEQSLERVFEIVFGDPFATPTRPEFGMFLAHAAGLKSAELGRQVGAALLNDSGDVVALGTNEVPSPAGGHYWNGDEEDDREFLRGSDMSDRLKARLISQVLDAVLSEEPTPSVRQLLAAELESTRLGDLIEFGRPVHAEMAAIVDAARSGGSTKGCSLYVTTFPCHLCTRLIIAAGIRRVEYIYPYPKSLAEELYGKQISTARGGSVDNRKIPFIPFLGVAPRRYLSAFQAPRDRKSGDGKAIPRHEGSPRLLIEDERGEWDLSTHIVREVHALEIAKNWLA
jgi:Deoxycytidylate deaminase